MKPYPAYKPSGVPWLGDVPAHWKKMRTANAFNLGSGTTPPTDEPEWYGGTVPWVQTSELRESVVLETEKNLTEAAITKFSALRVHQMGSVVVAMYGATIGRVGVLGVDAAVNQACCVLSPVSNVASRFMFWWLQAMRTVLALMGTGGGQPNISQEKIAQLRFFSPTVDEQEAIAAYLDRETARIDTLLAEKRCLIDTLREYRQATISEVVTQGLDPAAPKKPSGVPWLGDVPAHWAIKSLRRVTDGLAMNGIFKKNDEFGDGAPLVNVTDLFSDNFFVDGASLERVRCSEQELNQYQVCDGDLFLVRSSLKLEGIAMFAVARNIIEPTVFECHVVRLRPDSSLCNSRFMAFFLNSSYGRQSLISRSKSTTMTTIDQGEVLSTYIVSPPLDEQKAIAAYLDTETVRTDKLIEHVQDEIKLLQELRAATITDAVLGRIDVRTLTTQH